MMKENRFEEDTVLLKDVQLEERPIIYDNFGFGHILPEGMTEFEFLKELRASM